VGPVNDRELSAGGVVVRDRECIVIVPHKPSRAGKRVLGLPKGHPEEGESMPEAATREVREETGCEAELVEKLGDVSYVYQRKGRRIFKKVTFYRFEYRSGDVADHDHEIEEASWMGLAEAAEKLSYAGERDMAARALSRLASDQ